MDIDKMTRLQQVEYFRSMNGDAKYETLNEMIKQSEKVVFFGGAGVSTESGIPDFRSKDGLYNQKDVQFEKYEPEYLLSYDCLKKNPKVFFEFYRQKIIRKVRKTFFRSEKTFRLFSGIIHIYR